MDGSLEAGILEKILEDISEMYVEALSYPLIDPRLDSGWPR